MELWALGTSPWGLGIPEGRFWLLTPREYNALRAVYDSAHAAPGPAADPAAEQRVATEKLKVHNLLVRNRKARRLELIKRAQGTHVGAANG